MSDDELTDLSWVFRYDSKSHVLLLIDYTEWRRVSKRHKFCMVGSFYRWNENDRRQFQYARDLVHIDDQGAIPLPQWVLDEVSDRFCESLRVGRSIDFRERP